VAHASLESQMTKLRAHPSTLVWAFGSDCPVSAAHLQQLKDIARSLHWQDPTLDSVATWCNSNPGMKTDGPYSWEPPTLWWDTSQAGSAFGTTAEEGTESPPPLESLQKFIGPADLWPIGSVWNYHAGKPKSVFDNISRFTDGVDSRYGTTTSAADYAKKSEAMNYENTRSFFEASNAGENKTTFGTIFWMLPRRNDHDHRPVCDRGSRRRGALPPAAGLQHSDHMDARPVSRGCRGGRSGRPVCLVGSH
jgi:exo-1,4-beta-D-glucosaminidase